MLLLLFLKGGSVAASSFTPATVTVRATRPGVFGGYYRATGDEFDITSPYQYSPYWMDLVDTPPTDWSLAVYDAVSDALRIEFRGRAETRTGEGAFGV